MIYIVNGIITKKHRGIYYVNIENETIICKARGIFREKNITPIVGDKVDIRISSEDNSGYIEKVYNRKTQLYRPPVANIDQVMIFVSILEPNISLNLLDKYLLMAEKFNIEPIIVINKIDNVDKDKLNSYLKIYESIGYTVIINSNKNKTNKDIKKYLKNKITSIVGPSGVGKSTTLNSLFPDLNLEVGDISTKTKRGKHTTRHIEIKEVFKNSYVLDTPGFSSLEINFLDSKEEIKDYFKEFKEYRGQCKFQNCMHIKEPKCKIKEALDENKIYKSRYDNYLSFVKEYDLIRRY